MPYISRENRERFGPLFIDFPPILSSGELNYCITMLAGEYLRIHGMSYRSFNAIIGALECAKHELYRRVAADYEDSARGRNGDVCAFQWAAREKERIDRDARHEPETTVDRLAGSAGHSETAKDADGGGSATTGAGNKVDAERDGGIVGGGCQAGEPAVSEDHAEG